MCSAASRRYSDAVVLRKPELGQSPACGAVLALLYHEDFLGKFGGAARI